MAQSRVSAAGDQGIGTRPADLGAWDKLQLGWLDYEIVPAGQHARSTSARTSTTAPRRRASSSCCRRRRSTTEFGAPAAGEQQWWSGPGDDLDNSLTRQVTLPAGTATLTFQARWNIEDCGADACDYAYVEVDDGTGWKAIPGSITKAAEGNGIDGASDGWVPATFDLSAYAGKTIGLRFRYPTDGAAQGTDPDALAGLFADDITLTAGGHDGVRGRRRERRQRLDARRLQRPSARRRRRCTTTTTSPPTGSTSPTTVPADRPVQLRVPGRGRTVSSTSRTRTACWSPTGTLVHGQQRRASTRAGRDPADRRAPGADLPPRRPAVARRGSRPTTRRSRSRRPTRSPCTRTTGKASYIRGPGRAAGVRRPPVVLERRRSRRWA